MPDEDGGTLHYITPTTGASGTTTTYRVEVTDNCSHTVEKSATITVWPGLTADITASINGICIGTTTALEVSNLNGVGPYSYQWQSSATGEEDTWINISGATAAIYNAPIDEAGKLYYKVNVTDIGRTTGNCNTLTKETSVLVWPAFTAGTASADSTYCKDATATPLEVTVTGSGDYTYQWQSSGDNGTSWTNIAGATATTYTPSTANEGTDTLFQVTVTDNHCANPITVAVANIKVYHILSVADIAEKTICAGASTTLEPEVTGGKADLTYAWYLDNSLTPIEGADARAYTTPATDATAGATHTYTIMVTDACGSTAQNTFKVHVYEAVTATASASETSICMGGTIVLTATPSGGQGEGIAENYTYQWYDAEHNPIEGADEQTYAGGATNVAGNYTYYVKVTDPMCGTTDFVEVNYTVWPGLTADITAPIDGTCIGTTTPLEVTNLNNEGTPTYQWQMSLDGTDSWSGVGTDAATYNAPTDVADTFYYRVNITDNGRTSGCNTLTKETSVLVWPALAAENIENQSVCIGTTQNITAVVTAGQGAGHYHYQWQRWSDASTNYTNIEGAADAATYAAPINVAGTYFYKVVHKRCRGA